MHLVSDYCKLETSKSGIPIIAEFGGGLSRTGKCQLVAGAHGERIKPLFEPNRKYVNEKHAIFVAREGMLVARVGYWHGVDRVTIFRIAKIEQNDGVYYATLIEEFSEEGGDGNIPQSLREFADAALGKVHCYHCRCKHWGL